MWRREFENPPPFRWVTSRDEAIAPPLERRASYQAQALLTKTPRFELAPWSTLEIPLEANSQGQVIGPYPARTQPTMVFAPRSPLRAKQYERHVAVHREGLIGELVRRTDGWVLESKDLLLNGEALNPTPLVHGDCLETVDSRGAWLVTFPDCGEPDIGWGPLWRAFREGALHFEETERGLEVELHPLPGWSSLEVLELLMRSALPKRIARLKLDVRGTGRVTDWDALLAAHRAQARSAPFELVLLTRDRPPPADLSRARELGLAPHALTLRDGAWTQLAAREAPSGWVIDSLGLSFDSTTARWFDPFFQGEQGVVLMPNRSALFDRPLASAPTASTVGVFLDELLEVGDPAASLLREKEIAGALHALLFPFVSSDPFLGGIELSKSAHTCGFFTELSLKTWPECAAELPILLRHPLCRHVRRVRTSAQLSVELKREFPLVSFEP